MRLLQLSLTMGLLLAVSTPTASRAEWPSWVERWLFNPQERTQRGMEAESTGEHQAAIDALDTAARLEPEGALAKYNAGTSRLLAERPEAAPVLQNAAELAAEDLSPAANYNLGNARLAASDLPGAIEAYKSALRTDPSMEDAKFNLELALEQQQQQNQDQQDQEQQQDQDQQEQDQDQQDDQEQQQDDQEQQQDQQEQQQDQQEQQQDQQRQDQQEQDQQQQDQQQQQQEQQSPLPQFQDLPDMTAEEAAAILEAVENMEREQRRQEALEAMKRNASGKKDW